MTAYAKNGVVVCRADQLKVGQRVDLQCDPVADPDGYDYARDGEGSGSQHPEWAFEFETVAEIEYEPHPVEPAICVTFESGFVCGFPPDHEVEVDPEQPDSELKV